MGKIPKNSVGQGWIRNLLPGGGNLQTTSAPALMPSLPAYADALWVLSRPR